MPDRSSSVLQLRVDPPIPQRRLTVFFRFFMLIPQYIILEFINIAAAVACLLGWFAAVFTGRNPFHRFLSGALRWNMRVVAYSYLLTDQYPPFSLESESNYPVDVSIDQGQLGRLSVFFRGFLVIPASILLAMLGMGAAVFLFAGWLITLVRGRLPQPLHNAGSASLRFAARVSAYNYLLQNPYPGGLFGDRDSGGTTPATSASSAGSSRADAEGDLAAKYAAPATNQPRVARPTFLTPADAPLVSATPTSASWPPYPPTRDVASVESTRWTMTVTRGGRRLLIWFIAIGAIAYPAIFIVEAVALHGALHSLNNSLWSSEYEVRIASMNQYVALAESELSARPVNWRDVNSACALVQRSMNNVADVPLYPVTGPDRNLIGGFVLLGVGARTCTSIAFPQRNTADVAKVLANLRQAHQKFAAFLSEIPRP